MAKGGFATDHNEPIHPADSRTPGGGTGAVASASVSDDPVLTAPGIGVSADAIIDPDDCEGIHFVSSR